MCYVSCSRHPQPAAALAATVRPFKNRTLQYFEGKYKMRAIGALVTSFLCLAAVQAGYMLVEAHRNHHSALEVASNQEGQESHLAPQRIHLDRRRRKHEPPPVHG